jgi:hypothetical protein
MFEKFAQLANLNFCVVCQKLAQYYIAAWDAMVAVLQYHLGFYSNFGKSCIETLYSNTYINAKKFIGNMMKFKQE